MFSVKTVPCEMLWLAEPGDADTECSRTLAFPWLLDAGWKFV